MNGREGLSDLIDDDFEPQRSFESSILSAISPFFLVVPFLGAYSRKQLIVSPSWAVEDRRWVRIRHLIRS
jgi:hypothetical protein